MLGHRVTCRTVCPVCLVLPTRPWWRFCVAALRLLRFSALVQYWQITFGGRCSDDLMVSSLCVYPYQRTTLCIFGSLPTCLTIFLTMYSVASCLLSPLFFRRLTPCSLNVACCLCSYSPNIWQFTPILFPSFSATLPGFFWSLMAFPFSTFLVLHLPDWRLFTCRSLALSHMFSFCRPSSTWPISTGWAG